MTYFEGFIAPVPEANKEAYRKHSTTMSSLLLESGVRRMVENWDNQVPEGKLTDFRKAVNAKPDEKIVFAWFEYPSKEERDAASQRFMNDPRLNELGGDAPFDGKRLIYGGFESIVEEGSAGGGYTDGFVVPVSQGQREAYRQLASSMAKRFRDHGALRVVEAFSNDVPKGEVTDFYRAVQAKEDEAIVFSFVEWPDKQTRDQAWGKIMADDGEHQIEPPFDGKRMFWGGFDKIIDTAAETQSISATAETTE